MNLLTAEYRLREIREVQQGAVAVFILSIPPDKRLLEATFGLGVDDESWPRAADRRE